MPRVGSCFIAASFVRDLRPEPELAAPLPLGRGKITVSRDPMIQAVTGELSAKVSPMTTIQNDRIECKTRKVSAAIPPSPVLRSLDSCPRRVPRQAAEEPLIPRLAVPFCPGMDFVRTTDHHASSPGALGPDRLVVDLNSGYGA